MQLRLNWRPAPRLGWRTLRRLAKKMELKARPSGPFRLVAPENERRDIYFRSTLEEIRDLARAVIDRRSPTKETRCSLRQVAKAAATLCRLLEALPWRDRAALAAAVARNGLLGTDPNHLAGFAQAAADAASREEKSEAKRGRMREDARASFIGYLAERFELMGKRPGITDDDAKEKPYSGEFPEFVRECFELIGVTMSNKTLGKAIQAAPGYKEARRRGMPKNGIRST